MLERLNESDIKKKETGTGGITEASEGHIQTVFWNLLSEQGSIAMTRRKNLR